MACRCPPSPCASWTDRSASCASSPIRITSAAFPDVHSSREYRRYSDEMTRNVLIIGAGGVAQVVAHKCAQNNDILGNIHLASRTLSKCEAIRDSVLERKSMKVNGGFEVYQL